MRRFRLTRRAEWDLRSIWSYIAERNPAAADRTLIAIHARLSSLADAPLIGRERVDLIAGLRSFAVGNYVVFYRPDEEGITVFRVLHGARDIAFIFSQDHDL